MKKLISNFPNLFSRLIYLSKVSLLLTIKCLLLVILLAGFVEASDLKSKKNTGYWDVMIETDPLTDEVSLTIFLPSNDWISDINNLFSLGIKQINGNTTLYIMWNGPLKNGDLQLRFDSGPVEEVSWISLFEMPMVYLLELEDVKNFIARCMQHNTLVVGVNNLPGASPYTTFDLRGLGNVIDPYLEEMGWEDLKEISQADNDGDGYTKNEGDCDDNNKNIHPGAIEICGDGIDQDCNGSDLACGPPWTGNYRVQIQSTLSVKKVGKYIETHNGQLSFAQNGAFEMDDFTTTHDVTGNYSLDPKGKSILYTLTPAGKTALEASLIEWLTAYGLYDLDFTFDKIKTSKVKIDKNTGRATGKIKLDVSGTVSGCVPGEGCGVTKFKYKVLILLVD